MPRRDSLKRSPPADEDAEIEVEQDADRVSMSALAARAGVVFFWASISLWRHRSWPLGLYLSPRAFPVMPAISLPIAR